MKRILISGIIIGLFITAGTIAAVFYATGYRFSFNGGTGKVKFIEGTGLLVATSKPDGARVLINNDLTTATNNTINLAPEEYDVRIEKDGYVFWSKRILIKKGLVSEANALLIPTAPRLEAVTTIGISNVAMDESGSLLAYGVASASASKNGIYVLNMNSGPLVFLGATGEQIIDEAIDNFSQSKLTFSPDGKEILAEISNPTRFYLLQTSGGNQAPQDVTRTLATLEQDWKIQRTEADKKMSDSLPHALRPQAAAYFANMKLSPERDKILWTASASAMLPFVLKKQVPSLNSTPDQRELKKGNVYVYDIKEDKNFLIFDSSRLKKTESAPGYLWHAGSRHLIYAAGGKINIVEYDGGNLVTFYNGPFLDNLVFPWPNGSSIAIVSRLSESVPHNLYRISL